MLAPTMIDHGTFPPRTKEQQRSRRGVSGDEPTTGAVIHPPPSSVRHRDGQKESLRGDEPPIGVGKAARGHARARVCRLLRVSGRGRRRGRAADQYHAEDRNEFQIRVSHSGCESSLPRTISK